MLQRGHSGDGCVLASTLCKYDLRKGDLFVLNWARVLRVGRGSLSSELLMCGGGVRSILLLPLVARCLETIDVCIWGMFVFMSVAVTVWGSVGMCVAMGSAVLFIVRSRLLVYSEGSGVIRVQIVLSGFSKRLFCSGKIFMVVCISWLHSYVCVCGSDCDVVCICHNLNRCTGWW